MHVFNPSLLIEPVVNIINYTVNIVSSTAQLIVNAKVRSIVMLIKIILLICQLDSDCPFSAPSLLHMCTMCNDNTSCINLTIYNDAMITFNTTLPLDLLQCVSNLTWSNLHSSYINYINDSFSEFAITS